MVGELLIGSKNVAFLPSRASFSTTFLNNSSGGYGPGITTHFKAVVVVGKGMLSVNYYCSNKSSFCVSFSFCRSNLSHHRCESAVRKILTQAYSCVFCA